MMATEPVVDLVTACKALAARGCDTGIGGHVSLRDPERNEFWINCFDRTLGEMTVSDVVKLDHLGNNVLNDRVVSPGWEFHAGIYAQRPDVNAIVHTHGFWVTALASLNRPLRMRHNLCTLFYEDQVMSPDDSFDSIGAALGQASTIIIPWHGAITVGRSIGRAAALHATLEDMAKLDVTLDQSEAPELPEEARLPLRKLIDEVACYLEQTWTLMIRQADRYNP
jgi:L-fuculose-phosphate aldolase|tara:strand:- start:2039 stop:2710 length:672 start_codon:yes stop_codon:yes gene_type:complete